ncbi:MAG: PBP1A family penicillin-binding protein [Spirochaetes bacterium]|nr:PBP1A family penicillin-binding protein [Spirochaetota bacterium]
MKRASTLPIKIILLAALMLPFAYIIVAYSYSYSLLAGGLSFNPGVSTKIYDASGEIISELFEENRTIIESRTIPVLIKHAFCAAEDRDFYLHSGFDLPGIIRAIVVDIVSGDIRQGGSTITQQLVKQLYTKGERTLRRKIIEIFLAREFEKKFTKDEILEMYLNQIYFGHGVYGVNAAARFFFDKEIQECTPVEAALLASIPSSPNHFSPLKNPKAAFQKHKHILYAMIDAGHLSRADATLQFNEFWTAFLDKIRTKFPTLGVRSKSFNRAPHFTEYIRRILVNSFGEKRVYRGGLEVHTTLDLRQQEAARESLVRGIVEQNDTVGLLNRSRLDDIDRLIARQQIEERKIRPADLKDRSRFLSLLRRGALDDLLLLSALLGTDDIAIALEEHRSGSDNLLSSSRVEGALIAIDPFTGGVTAMVGGSDFNSKNQLNRAVQSVRQPGSAFKAFVYGAGIESRKITAATPFYDVPVVFRGEEEKVWKPSNYEKTYKGKVLVRAALAASLNIVSVLVVDEINPKSVANFASRLMGIPLSRFAVDPSISLGTSEVSPLEMARGFSVFANGGRLVRPFTISRIIDKEGRTVYDGETTGGLGKRVISEATAFIMTSLLRSVVDSGTATGGIRGTAAFHLPAGGKTGTTSKFRDAWFVGFTPDLVAAVWMGCDSQKFSLGGGQSASVVAAPVWGNFMREVYTFRKPSRFREQPEGITTLDICAKTGKLPVDGCPVQSEYFLSGTEPTEQCSQDHDEMTSIFDLVRKDKGALLKKEKSKRDAEIEEDKEE